MKNIARKLSALLLVFVVSMAALCPAFAATASLPSLPSGQCVVDDANVLSSSTVQTITDLNAQLESSCSGAQIGVLTVDYTGNLTTEDYALQAFNTWGIGSSSENNGVLILLVMESQEYEDGDYYLTYGDGFRNTTLESQASALAQTMEDDFVRQDYDDAVTTCAQNVAQTIADIYGVGKKEREERIRRYADVFGLTADLAQPLSEYSHGMKQKLAIISALLHEPKLILMDEPFVGLDPTAAYQLKTIMREHCDRGGAIFFSTHVLEVAEKLCDKVAIIKGGRLIASGTMEEVKGDQSLEDVFLELEGEGNV